jgi:hypothetical protein
VSRTDTSTRAYAAAEGGLERALALSENEYVGMLARNFTNCPSGMIEPAVNPVNPTYSGEELPLGLDPRDAGCMVTFTSEGDNIGSRARIYAVEFTENAPGEYWFSLDTTAVKEVRLEGYSGTSVDLCWDNITNTALYYVLYTSNGTFSKGGLYRDGSFVNSLFLKTDNTSGDSFTPVTSGDGNHGGCQTISTLVGSDPAYGIRIHALYDSSLIAVKPESGYELPVQGYKIKSIGEIFDGNDVIESKLVEVYKSFSYLPSFFDYNIYATGSIYND